MDYNKPDHIISGAFLFGFVISGISFMLFFYGDHKNTDIWIIFGIASPIELVISILLYINENKKFERVYGKPIRKEDLQ